MRVEGAALQEAILTFLDEHARWPAFESLAQDPATTARLINAIAALTAAAAAMPEPVCVPDTVEKWALNDEEAVRLEALSDGREYSDDDIAFLGAVFEQNCPKPCLRPYLESQLRWAALAILNGMYANAGILLRSSLELLANLASRRAGSPRAKISGLAFLSPRERDRLKEAWDKLAARREPFQRRGERICAALSAYGPAAYHRGRFQSSVELLEQVVDFYLVVAREHFGLEAGKLQQGPGVDWAIFPMLLRHEGGQSLG